MITNNYLLSKVQSIYSNRQANKDQNSYILTEKLLSDKEYKKVYYELNRAIFELEKAKYNNEGNIEALSKAVNDLKEQKQSIYNNIAKNYSPIKHVCENCKDTGEISDSTRCHCFYENLTDICYEFLGLNKPKLVSFDDDTLSSQNGYEHIFEKCRLYSKNFSAQSKSLLFSGSAGTGKTFLAQAIANEISKSNFNVLYFSTFDFNQALLNYHLANSFDKSIYYDILTTCDLLVIDDLGCEPIYKNVTIEYLLSVLSQRLQLKKPIIITTNLTPEKLLDRYGERIYSRLCSRNTVRQLFKGKDLRK